jgi:hypothetical protein
MNTAFIQSSGSWVTAGGGALMGFPLTSFAEAGLPAAGASSSLYDQSLSPPLAGFLAGAAEEEAAGFFATAASSSEDE